MRSIESKVIRLFAVALLLTVYVNASAADSKAIDEIKKTGRALDQALIDKNIAVLKSTFADDCVGIWADGSTSTKSEMIENVQSEKYKMFSVTYAEENVRIYGNTAVSRVLSTADEEYDGKRGKVTTWSTGVWVREKDAWKLVSVHISNKL